MSLQDVLARYWIKVMNPKHGFQRITLILAILVGIICGYISVSMLIDKRSTALSQLAECELEFMESIRGKPIRYEWTEGKSHSEYLQELCIVLINRRYPRPDAKFMSEYGVSCEKAVLLMGAHSYWTHLSTNEFIGLVVLIGFGCAIGGFCSTWFVYGIIRLVFVPLVCWVIRGFHQDTI